MQIPLGHYKAPLWATLATTVGWFMAVSMQQFNFMELNHEWWDREDWIKENWHRFEAEAQAVLGEHANKVRIGYKAPRPIAGQRSYHLGYERAVRLYSAILYARHGRV